MAITVTNPNVAKSGWIANGTSANLSGCEELKAAPGPGKYLCIRQLVISSAAAISITVGEGETASAVTTALLGPIAFSANQTIPWIFEPAMQLTVNTSLTVDADGAGVVTVFAQGYTK